MFYSSYDTFFSIPVNILSYDFSVPQTENDERRVYGLFSTMFSHNVL